MRQRKLYDNHHRKPRSRGGDNSPRNIVRVPRNKHEAFHLLFENHSPEEIATILNDFWIDTDYFMVAVPRLWK